MGKSFFLSDELQAYLLASTTPTDEVLRELQQETAALGRVAGMQIAPEQGAFLTNLALAMGARDIIEIGTFTGYSAICLARGLAPGGRLRCFDVNEEWTAIGRRYWEKAGLTESIELTLGPASVSLSALPDELSVDLAFIDADKAGYPDYVEQLLPRLRRNGLLLLDNTLRGGAVLPPASSDANDDTRAIIALNAALASDPRVDVVLLPIADGLSMVRKR